MSMLVATFVDLDYHHDSIQVCVLDQEGKQLCNWSVENDDTMVERVAAWYGRPRSRLAGCAG